MVSLKAEHYLSLLRSGPTSGVEGGRTYDTVIFDCEVRAGVRVLLTLNERHYRPFQSANLKVVVPRTRA